MGNNATTTHSKHCYVLNTQQFDFRQDLSDFSTQPASVEVHVDTKSESDGSESPKESVSIKAYMPVYMLVALKPNLTEEKINMLLVDHKI